MMEKLKKVSRAQWCLFALFIGFAFLMQNCSEDDVLIYEENQTETELNARPVSGKVDVCRYNERKGTYSVVSLIAKFVPSKLLPGDVILDADGDGYVKENSCSVTGLGIDCDDTNAAITSITYYADADGDGFGNPDATTQACSLPTTGYVENNLDCDDTNAGITTSTIFYHDGDNDTFGDPDDSIIACVAPENYVTDNTDCDDTNGGITTGTIFYHDGDNDTFGDPDDSIVACAAPEYYVTDNTDCDDTNAAINPAVEICGDEIDNDCDGEIDEAGCVEKTNVPDDNFEQALIDLSRDDVLDGYVLTANINTITSLDVSGKSISDLTGIEDFAALRSLKCNNNLLTSLNLSNNTDLWILYCHNNQINSLIVSNNAELRELQCYINNLENLDVSSNLYLHTLICYNNQLTSLNLIDNTALGSLLINDNLLTSLDVSNNNLISLWCYNNPSLSCIQVNSTQLGAIPSNWIKDATAGYSTNCSL